MKIELINNKKVILDADGSKKEIHPFWLRERVSEEKYLDKGTNQRLFDPASLDSEIKIKELEKNSSSSAIASTPDKDSTFKDKIITLKFIDSTWIQLRDNQDNIVFSKLMNQDEEYSYNLSKNLNLTAGNAGNIIVAIDGVVKGKVGKLGEVVESLVIDINFKK